MRTTWLLLAALALAAVIACGGAGEQLTVREYAEACGDLEIGFSSSVDLDDLFSVGDPDDIDEFEAAIEEIEDLIQEYKDLNPPDSLQDLHEARVDVLDFIEKEMLDFIRDVFPLLKDAFSAMEDGDWDELEKLEEEFTELEDEVGSIEDDFEELVADADEVFDDLSSRNREILRDNDCD